MNQRMKKLNPWNISGFPGGTSGKESACQWRWPKSCGFDLRVGKILWNRNGNLLQCSCLENPKDRGTWWVTVHGAAKSQTQLRSWAHTAVAVVHSVVSNSLRPHGLQQALIIQQISTESYHTPLLKVLLNSLIALRAKPKPKLPSMACEWIAQLRPTLCDPVDCSLPGSCPWNSPGKNTEAGCHFLLWGVFLTQGSNVGLPQLQADSFNIWATRKASCHKWTHTEFVTNYVFHVSSCWSCTILFFFVTYFKGFLLIFSISHPVILGTSF